MEFIQKNYMEDYLDGVSIDKIGDTVTEEIKKLSKAGFFENKECK